MNAFSGVYSVAGLSDCDPASRAFVYVFSVYSRSRSLGAVYVGQTNDARGPLSRLSGHLSAVERDDGSIVGTLASRIEALLHLSLYEVRRWCCDFYALPRERAYEGRSTEFREGVEYLVDKGLRRLLVSAGVGAVVVSQVRFNRATRVTEVRGVAQDILGEVESTLIDVWRDRMTLY